MTLCCSPTAVSCGIPEPPGNGSFAGTEFTLDSRVTYGCDEGFRLDAGHPATAVCQEDGSWSNKGRPPPCKRKFRTQSPSAPLASGARCPGENCRSPGCRAPHPACEHGVTASWRPDPWMPHQALPPVRMHASHTGSCSGCVISHHNKAWGRVSLYEPAPWWSLLPDARRSGDSWI